MSGPTPNPVISTFLDRAVKAVPAIKYALGIGGVVAVIAIVFSFGINAKVAIFGTIIMLVLMVVLVLFASLVRKPGASFSLPALIFTWFSLSLFMASSLLLFTSAFWATPIDLRTSISAPKQTSGTNPNAQGSSTQNNLVPQPNVTFDPPKQHEHPKYAAADQPAREWEIRGDQTASFYIMLEIKGRDDAKSQEDIEKLAAGVREGFKQARTAWTNALDTAVTKQYKAALQTKLKGSVDRGLTCESTGESDNDILCYANGSKYDVLSDEGVPGAMAVHVSNKP